MTVTDDLITLKAQYEYSLEAVSAKVGHYQDQLEHINALLIEQLTHQNGFIAIKSLPPLIPLPEITSLPAAEVLPLAPLKPSAQPIASPSSSTKIKTTGKGSSAKTEGRVSLPLLSEYQGMKKQDAISKLLASQSGNILSMDAIIEKLYGALSPQIFKVERVRMKSALYQGAKQKLWQKASQPYSYFLKPSNTTAPAAPIISPSTSVSLSSSKKVASSLKSLPPIIKLPTQKTTPSKRKPKTTTVKTTPKDQQPKTQIISLQSKSLGARIILPMHEDFAGLSKIDAVLKVMKERAGKPVHVEDIMERLFGYLSPEEARVEKGRMKDVMNRGRERALWSRAAAPMSFIVSKMA